MVNRRLRKVVTILSTLIDDSLICTNSIGGVVLSVLEFEVATEDCGHVTDMVDGNFGNNQTISLILFDSVVTSVPLLSSSSMGKLCSMRGAGIQLLKSHHYEKSMARRSS